MSLQVITKAIAMADGVRTQLLDIEWRLFKEWQRVVPNEPFETTAYKSIRKRAAKEGINTDNIIEINA